MGSLPSDRLYCRAYSGVPGMGRDAVPARCAWGKLKYLHFERDAWPVLLLGQLRVPQTTHAVMDRSPAALGGCLLLCSAASRRCGVASDVRARDEKPGRNLWIRVRKAKTCSLA